MSHRGLLRRLALAVALLGVSLIAAPAALAASSPFSFTTSTIDLSASLTDVACPANELCVAVDDQGRVLTSTDPAARIWSLPASIDGSALTAISCSSVTLCVAVDASGNVLTSTAPAAGAASWSAPAAIDAGHALSAVSCPATASLCVAVDDAGRALTSQTPAAGAAGWSAPVTIGDGSALSDVSCGSQPPPIAAQLCGAVDVHGETLLVSDPTSSVAWSSAAYPGGPAPATNRFVSCTPLSCTATGSAGALEQFDGLTGPITDPGPQVMVGALTDITCLTGMYENNQFCAAVGRNGVFATRSPRDPTGRADLPSWVTTHAAMVDTRSVACPSDGLCIAVGANGDVTTAVGAALSVTASGQNWGNAGLIAEGGLEPNETCMNGCTLYYPLGATVQLFPHLDNSLNTFAGWGGACSGTASPCSLTLTGQQSVSLTFTPPPPLPGFPVEGMVSVTLAGTGSGSASDQAWLALTCPTWCAWMQPVGTSISFIATPNPGSVFAGWSGACSGTGVCTVITTAQQQAAIATFVPGSAGVSAPANNAASQQPAAPGAPVAPAPSPPVAAPISALTVHAAGSTATVAFKLRNAVRGSVQCALVRIGGHRHAHFARCRSGTRFAGLRNGRYELIVRARTASGSHATTTVRRAFTLRHG